MITKCGVCGDYRSPAAGFQDETYGKGKRVHNPQGAKAKGKFRCTVCGNSIAPSVPKVAKS